MSAAVPAPTESTRQVETQLINLSETAEELLLCAGELSARLAPVSVVKGPGGDSEDTAQETLVPVAERMALVSKVLDDTLNVLRSVLRRLEV